MAKEKDMNNESEGSLLKGAISALQAENEKNNERSGQILKEINEIYNQIQGIKSSRVKN